MDKPVLLSYKSITEDKYNIGYDTPAAKHVDCKKCGSICIEVKKDKQGNTICPDRPKGKVK